MSVNLLVVGSIAFDTVTTPFGKVRETLGGSATYFSFSASYFSTVGLVGVVGHDFPREHLESFKGKGIDTKGLEVLSGETFRWEGEYGYDLNEAITLSTHLNVFEHFHPRLPEGYKEAPFLFLANIDPVLQLEVLEQMKSLQFVACDTMNLWIANRRQALMELLKKVDLVVLNDSEARQLTGEPNLAKAGRSIQALGCPKVIVKKGEHGSLFFSHDAIFCAPAFPLEFVYDPTGAGDSFAGGLMGYISQQGEVNEEIFRKGIIIGSVMASYTVERFGLEGLASLKEEDITRRFEEFRGITQF